MADTKADSIIDSLSGVLGDARLLYLSTPVNGGLRLVRHLLRQKSDGFEERVLLPNIEAATALAREIRRCTGSAVFDPSCFRRYPGWTQEDYLDACLKVLDAFAEALVLAPGWEFSRGCTVELSHALATGLPVLDHRLRPVDSRLAGRRLAFAERLAAACGWELQPDSPSYCAG